MIPVRGPHQSEALGGCLVCLCLRPALVWNFSDASQRNRRPILCGWQHFENATTNSAVWSASKIFHHVAYSFAAASITMTSSYC